MTRPHPERDKRILELYAQGVHIMQIRKVLKDEGYKPLTNGRIHEIARENGIQRPPKATKETKAG